MKSATNASLDFDTAPGYRRPVRRFKIEGVEWLQRYVAPSDTVIDFGCGLMPVTRKLVCKKIIGIEAYGPYIEAIRADLSDRKNVFLWQMNLTGFLMDRIRTGSADVALAIDVVEHLEKRDSERLIRDMERIAKKRVVIFTPIGFVPQERAENSELQRHRCGYEPAEMERHGYETMIRIGGDVPSFLAVKELIA